MLSFRRPKISIPNPEQIAWEQRERTAAEKYAQHLEDRDWLRAIARAGQHRFRYRTVDLGSAVLGAEVVTGETVSLTVDGVDIVVADRDITIHHALVVASLAPTHTTVSIHPAGEERNNHTVIYKPDRPLYCSGDYSRRSLTTDEAAQGLQIMHAATLAIGQRLCSRTVKVG